MHETPPPVPESESSRRAPVLLGLLGLLLMLPWLGARDLWNPDEPRYAEVAREMSVDGDYLVPHLNGEIYAQKPPLFFWSIDAAAGLLGRFDEWSVRLPSALAGVGTILLVDALGRRLFTARVGWIAALAYATCFKVLWQARVGQIDMLLAFLVALSAWLWVRGYQESSRVSYRLFFLAAGLATLAKGPVGLLPFLLSAVAYLWVSDEKSEIRAMQIGRGLLLWAAPVAAWLAAATAQAGTGYLREMVLTQNLTRYFSPGSTAVMSGHVSPWYHYLTTLPVDFLPWSFLLPAALWVPAREGSWRRSAGFRFAVCWTVVPLVFFSLSAAKRSVYLLPMFPALALLVAHHFDTVARTGRRHRLALVAPLGSVAALFLAVAVLLPVEAGRRPAVAALGAELPTIVAVLLAALGVCAAAGAWTASRGRSGSQRRAAGRRHGPYARTVGAGLAAAARPDPSSRRARRQALLERLGPDEVRRLSEDRRASLFYMRRLAHLLPDAEALRRYPSEGGRWSRGARRRPLRGRGSADSKRLSRPQADEGVALLKLIPPQVNR
ncbi:MAG: glycosyltransferase family 39 protein [Thermoanaerobaculia bacterium]